MNTPENGPGGSPSPQCARLKGAFPFRLGTTSYIIPDDILPNLDYLRDRVDDVELVLFESDEYSNLPAPEAVEQIGRLGREANLTYTVHLPLDIRLGSADEAERLASVGKCRRVIERMRPVEPFGWILHLHGEQRGDPPTTDLPRWRAQNRRSLRELLAGGMPPHQLCVETLDYDFDLVAGLVEEFDFSVCLDIGHLLAHHRDVAAHLERWQDRARVFHVHGVNSAGADHNAMDHIPAGILEDLAGRLARLPEENERVMTMEIFGKDDFERSCKTVAERMGKWRK